MSDVRTPDPNTCDHGVPLHEECDRCWHDHRVRVDSRTSKNRTLDRFIDLMQQYGAAFAAYEHHHGAWEVDRLAQAREALIAQYRTDGAEIERLTRELEVEKEVNDLAYTSPRHLVKSRNRLLAMLLELQDEIQAVMNGEHGADWADHFAPLFNLVQRAKALSGEHSAPETSGEPEPVAFVGYVNEHPDIIYPGTTRLEGRRYLPIWRPEDHPCARRDAPSEIRVGDTVTMERYRQRGEHEGWIVTWIRDTPDGKFYDVRHPRGGATSASADEIRLSQKAGEKP